MASSTQVRKWQSRKRHREGPAAALNSHQQNTPRDIYFMDHLPVDWHDVAMYHDSGLDRSMRCGLIEKGIYFFPLPTKQCSISAAHGPDEISMTLEAVEQTLAHLADSRGVQRKRAVMR